MENDRRLVSGEGLDSGEDMREEKVMAGEVGLCRWWGRNSKAG
jgi:hypothetical protein